MEKAEYRYERLSKENIHHLKTLFKLIFKKDLGIGFLLDKYNTEHLGKSFLGHIAFHDQRPVAYGGFIPYKIQYMDTMELAAQSVDSMALKEVSGKGVFKKIGYLNEELLIAEGINFGFGFGNQDSVPVFVLKFNWFTNERLSAFLIPVKGIPKARILNKMGLKESFDKRVKKVISDLVVHEIFTNPFAYSQSGFIVYDHPFFQYKKGQGRYVISIDGIKIWIKTDHRLSVGAIEHCAEDKFLGIVEKLIEIAGEIGFSEVLLQFSPFSAQAAILKKTYTGIEASPICFKVFSSQIPMEKILFSGADLDTF